jgi:hypothetical protein
MVTPPCFSYLLQPNRICAQVSEDCVLHYQNKEVHGFLLGITIRSQKKVTICCCVYLLPSSLALSLETGEMQLCACAFFLFGQPPPHHGGGFFF